MVDNEQRDNKVKRQRFFGVLDQRFSQEMDALEIDFKNIKKELQGKGDEERIKELKKKFNSNKDV